MKLQIATLTILFTALTAFGSEKQLMQGMLEKLGSPLSAAMLREHNYKTERQDNGTVVYTAEDEHGMYLMGVKDGIVKSLVNMTYVPGGVPAALFRGGKREIKSVARANKFRYIDLGEKGARAVRKKREFGFLLMGQLVFVYASDTDANLRPELENR